MKKMFQCFMVASIFVACNSKSDLDSKKDVILVDTTGMYKSNIMTDTGSVITTTTLTNPNKNAAVANRQYTNTNTTTRNNRNVSRNTASTNNNTSTTTVRRRRGWSHAAKDATIGGVGGAVLGAVISRNKVQGAIIGGVVGAGGGYILGRSKDKREGRVR